MKNWTARTKGVVSSFSPPKCLVLSRTTHLRHSNYYGYTQAGMRKNHYSSTSIAVTEISIAGLSHTFNQPRGTSKASHDAIVHCAGCCAKRVKKLGAAEKKYIHDRVRLSTICATVQYNSWRGAYLKV